MNTIVLDSGGLRKPAARVRLLIGIRLYRLLKGCGEAV